MLIIHGTRRTKTRLGLVAELCPRCHDIKPAVVTRVEQCHHVYFMPVGSKKLVGFEVQCGACRNNLIVKDAAYAGFSKEDPGDIGLLVETTNPGVVDRLAQRIDMEERLANGTATRADRVTVITEAIAAAGGPVQAKLHNVLPSTGLSLMGTLVFGIAWAVLASARRPEPISLYAAGAATLLSLAVFIVTAATGKGRLIRKHVLPALAAELAPLSPSRTELTESLNGSKKNKLALARLLEPEVLEAAVARAAHAITRRGG
jgi:hypothetical protein